MHLYRPNSAIILKKTNGKVLVAERRDTPGAWQFPQGGGKKKETPLQTLHREIAEEIGLNPRSYEILMERGPYRYQFPPGRQKEGFTGQEQTYFLAGLLDESLLMEGAVESEEFRAIRWIQPQEFRLAWVPEFKRAVYAAVFSDFFDLVLKSREGDSEIQ
jgi:putative (di)nucleoside polyphosphate hydrolase